MPADAVPLKRQQVHDLYADPTHIAAAGKIISEAENPVILVGTGAVRAHAAAAITEMADRLHIPVVNTMMAKGVVPKDDRYSLWTIGIPRKTMSTRCSTGRMWSLPSAMILWSALRPSGVPVRI